MVKQFLILSLLIISTGSFAQKSGKKQNSLEKHQALPNTFEKGQVDINIGVGLIANRYYYGRGYSVTPPLTISVDKAVTENISVGGYFAYVRAVYRSAGSYTYYDNNGGWIVANYDDKVTISYGVLGLRGAFHVNEYIQVENLDLYAGAMLGYSFAKFKYTTSNSNGRANPYSTRGYGGLVGSFYLGGRYRFTEKFGVYGEFGYGLAYGNIGLNIKL
jgi:hypothetical protein